MKKNVRYLPIVTLVILFLVIARIYFISFDPLDLNCKIKYDPFVGPRSGHHCHGYIGDLDNPEKGGFLDIKDKIKPKDFTEDMQFYKNKVFYKNNYFYYITDEQKSSDKSKFIKINVFSGEYQSWNSLEEIPTKEQKIFKRLES